jgi:hypothetical protein
LRLIALQHFHPPGLPRAIRVGERLEATDELGRVWVTQGLARLDEPAAEAAILRPAEAAIEAPAEKAIRKPRENAARKKR